jgi:hypothetical protein
MSSSRQPRGLESEYGFPECWDPSTFSLIEKMIDNLEYHVAKPLGFERHWSVRMKLCRAARWMAFRG